MTDIKFAISEELRERMKKYPEIIWEKVAKSAIEKFLEKLEVADKIASKSSFTMEDSDKLGDEIKQKMWERHKFYLENLKK
ncbi:MAG: hypothetical protein EU540_00570 [Promethearchaeota archaeon]|nr:MAG: hypothetical protein EU540_00570 [Candidatus Lokiarchaeota archaeon]